jgi:aryl-alcohol dehydrogenase-like predicted oxidoreductase
MGLVSEQSRYNLAVRTVELEVMPACQAYGLALLAYGPLRGGMLAGGVVNATEGRRASEGAQKLLEEHRSQVEAYEALCREASLEPARVAQAWLLHRPYPVIPIMGPRTLEQMEHKSETTK